MGGTAERMSETAERSGRGAERRSGAAVERCGKIPNCETFTVLIFILNFISDSVFKWNI